MFGTKIADFSQKYIFKRDIYTASIRSRATIDPPAKRHFISGPLLYHTVQPAALMTGY